MANHTFQITPDRRIGVSAAGDPVSKRMVVLCHPTPGAGGFDPDPVATEHAGVHLMMYDRPGYGASDPLPKSERPTVQGHADELATILGEAKEDAVESAGVHYGKVAVIGWGSGGRYALSLAARHPDLVDDVVIVGTPAPGRVRRETRSAEARDLLPIGLGRSVDNVAEELSERDESGYTVLGVNDDDREFDQKRGLRHRLDHMLEEARMQGWIGVASDLIAASDEDWVSQLGDIQAPVLLIYGTSDPLAGTDDADEFARRIPETATQIVDRATRLLLSSEWATLLARLAPRHGDEPDRLRDKDVPDRLRVED